MVFESESMKHDVRVAPVEKVYPPHKKQARRATAFEDWIGCLIDWLIMSIYAVVSRPYLDW